MMPREKSRFLTFILVFNSFCRLPSSSLLNWKVLSSTTATADASSLPIMRFLRPPPWKKWLSCVHFFLNICRKSQKSTRRRRLFLLLRRSDSLKSYLKFFGFTFRLLLAFTNTVRVNANHQQPTDSRIPFLLPIVMRSLNATRSSLFRHGMIFIIFAECKSMLQQELFMLLVFIHFWFDFRLFASETLSMMENCWML